MLDKNNLPDVPFGYCQCGCGEQTPIAIKTRTKIGHIKGQPIRFVHGHSGKCAKPNRKIPEHVELRPIIVGENGTALIPLPDGSFALIDEADIEIVRSYNWGLSSAGNGRHYVRGRASRTGSPIYLHILIMAPQSGMKIDHINGDTSDNRRVNLRSATHAENMQNSGKKSNNTSGFKGVSRAWDGVRWRATIGTNGKQLSLGIYATPEEAAHAYDAKAREIQGAFARVNFPEDAERQA